MNKQLFTVLITIMVCSAGQVSAQEMQTLFDDDLTHGAFGGPIVKFDNINDEFGFWVGGRGGWIINFGDMHAVSLGGGGYGLTTNHEAPSPEDVDINSDADELFATTGYGGFILEYTNRSYQLVHMTANTLIGAGGLMIRERHFEDVDEVPEAYFVFEPGLNAELNVTSFFRIAAGFNYRLTSGINKAGFRDSDFSGANATLTLKFGYFR